ncbi:MAG TPA: PIN domain-containing protein [Bryobacteraceae bacterium]
MKVLVDTNVILDVLLERRSHAEASAVVWGMLEEGAGRGLVSSHAVPTLIISFVNSMPFKKPNEFSAPC